MFETYVSIVSLSVTQLYKEMQLRNSNAGKVSKNIPIPLQPKNREDEIYVLINQYTTSSDYTAFANEMTNEGYPVSRMTVNYVCRGLRRNEKVWSYVIQKVTERKEQTDAFKKSYTQPI